MNDKNQALTSKEVAKFLNISNQMVYNLIKTRELKAFKIGSAIRILHSDMMNFIEGKKTEFIDESAPDPEFVNNDPTLFVLDRLTSHYDTFQLTRISLTIPLGKIVTVLGSSGSGKSLLLRTIAGLEKPDSGVIYFGIKRLDTLSPGERNIGFVFQNFALLPRHNSSKNIGFPLAVNNTDKDDSDIRIEDVAVELGLNPADMDKLPRELSVGMKQLVAIGRAKIKEPDLLLMDEPLSNLDAGLKEKMRIAIKRIVHTLGKTTILATNDPIQALSMADYIVVLHEGRLVQSGTRDDVYSHPLEPIVMNLLSRGAVNEINVAVKKGTVVGFDLPTDKKDGSYMLYFRAEEVRPAELGIEININKTGFYDGGHVIAWCTTHSGIDIEVILPAGDEEIHYIMPDTFHLFPV